MGKLVQAFMYGAKVVAIDGNFDDALRLVREIGETEPVAIVNSINPHRIEGQKTASFEIIEELGAAPDLHILPVGNAGNITAYWKGYREFHELGRAASAAEDARLPGRRGRADLSRQNRSKIRRPSPAPSASAIPRAGNWPPRPSASRTAPSIS